MDNNNNNQDKIIKSSIIQAYNYNPSSLELTITFKNNNTWVYKKVNPELISKVFDSSGSVGSKFLRLIKPSHQAIQSND